MPLPNDEREKLATNTKFRRTEWLRLVAGQHQIRLLQPLDEARLAYTHWVNPGSIECIEEECPICKSNELIMAEHPETFRNISGWNPWRKTYYINVLDRTPAKVCPSCNYENKRNFAGMYASVCGGANCNIILHDLEERPLNVVKILSRGKELFEDYFQDVFERTILDEEKNPIPITSYDIVLMKSDGKAPIPVAKPDMNDVVEVDEAELFDTSNIVVRCTEEEIHQLMRGVSLRDVLVARRAKEEAVVAPTAEEVEKVEAISKEATDRAKSLFSFRQ